MKKYEQFMIPELCNQFTLENEPIEPTEETEEKNEKIEQHEVSVKIATSIGDTALFSVENNQDTLF